MSDLRHLCLCQTRAGATWRLYSWWCKTTTYEWIPVSCLPPGESCSEFFWHLARQKIKGQREQERKGEKEREGRNEPSKELAATRRLAQSAVNPVTSCRRGEESGAGVAEVSSLFIDLLNSAKEDRGAPRRLKRAGSFRD